MADIFISYSSQERQVTHDLAKYLESEGYSVWWDAHLIAGERFGAVITREMDAARTVIVIWTPHSVASRWVIAEAERAERDEKLITLRTKDLDPRRIPLPYNALHTDDVDDREAVLRAVVRLVGPPSPPLTSPPSPASAARRPPLESLLSLARARNVSSLVEICRQLSPRAIEDWATTYGGSLHYWLGRRMIFGVNIAGERYKRDPTPFGELDVWIPAPKLSEVVGVPDAAIRQSLVRDFGATKAGVTDCIVRLKSPEVAQRLITLLESWIDPEPNPEGDGR